MKIFLHKIRRFGIIFFKCWLNFDAFKNWQFTFRGTFEYFKCRRRKPPLDGLFLPDFSPLILFNIKHLAYATGVCVIFGGHIIWWAAGMYYTIHTYIYGRRLYVLLFRFLLVFIIVSSGSFCVELASPGKKFQAKCALKKYFIPSTCIIFTNIAVESIEKFILNPIYRVLRRVV